VSLSEETLMAYADEQAEPQLRAQVEAAMATDPLLARRISQHRALRARLRAAFDKVLDEPVPERLVASARSAPTLQRRNNVVPLRRKPPPARWSWIQLGTLAASLIVGIALGQLLPRATSSGPVTSERNGALLPSPALARALSNQLAAEQTATAPVQIGVSFRSHSGDFCRTFAIHGSVMAGLACHEREGWRVRVLTEHELQLTERPYALPASITQAIAEQLSSEPLDAGAEAAARARDWRP